MLAPKEGTTCIIIVLIKCFPYADGETELYFQGQKAALVLKVSDKLSETNVLIPIFKYYI